MRIIINRKEGTQNEKQKRKQTDKNYSNYNHDNCCCACSGESYPSIRKHCCRLIRVRFGVSDITDAVLLKAP